mmetsp:Transcript_28887/g.35133  ORF Transcript_28887/g.35133 Transcript_28887/m.35133 type:complete len:231 (+) Transcript_28887:110-802(+)|eukprot:CAMPEP_0172497322 /NCGR_PEP_ID=MMETSP1066-20121228/98244_1 /TAXON_ID=671091 /ORGANISM="Coscinodiscus wailesii, Strain CCMP2513" /LENGTH=230 /DNA_ID=CAMNT_0013270019 /DNA_START=80 /DNA_END=772 /DNA_ORIENTATION=+
MALFQFHSFVAIVASAFALLRCDAWVIRTPTGIPLQYGRNRISSRCPTKAYGNAHGENSCFLPLVQLDQDFYAPRIVQIAGTYPGLTVEEFEAVTSEPAPAAGQWTYDFSDPDGPQMGTVALEGSKTVSECEDPVVIIAEHFAMGVVLPAELVDPVDLVVLVDRAERAYDDRAFLVVDRPGEGLKIEAYNSKNELPEGCRILGRVILVNIPWLPAMTPTKTGFAEADEYF